MAVEKPSRNRSGRALSWENPGITWTCGGGRTGARTPDLTDVTRGIFLHSLYLSAPNRTICLRFLRPVSDARPRSYRPVPLRLHTKLHTSCAAYSGPQRLTKMHCTH